jgi:hypothetical protein
MINRILGRVVGSARRERVRSRSTVTNRGWRPEVRNLKFAISDLKSEIWDLKSEMRDLKFTVLMAE